MTEKALSAARDAAAPLAAMLTEFARPDESYLSALLRAGAEGYCIDKAADPTEGYREDLTPQQAAAVAAIDPSLIELVL